MIANLFINGNGSLGMLIGTTDRQTVMWVPCEPDEQGKRHSRMLKVMSPWSWGEIDVVIVDFDYGPALACLEVVEL